MDELELVQEAVANWENLDEVESVEALKLPRRDGRGPTYMSRIALRGRELPVYLEMTILNVEPEGIHEDGIAVAWRPPQYVAESD